MASDVNRQFTPASPADVVIDDNLWADRIRVNREVTIPCQYRWFKKTGRIDGFELKWVPGDGQSRHQYHDSDVAKWVEAVCYTLAGNADAELARLADEVVTLIVGAQLPDGYLNTYYSVVEPERRWTNLYDGHELYCAGHLIEAAVAHFEATGKTNFLDCVRRYADYIDTVFGAEPGKKRGYCGHPEIELALVKLYRATGEKRYLRLSRYFVDERGREPHYYDQEALARGRDPSVQRAESDDYEAMHARVPLREQAKVAGHAVRAMYVYSATADLAAEFGDKELLTACKRLWDNLVSTRLYIHGGVGSARRNEGFTEDYDLPNDTAYAELCAAIGVVFWCHRMLQIECDSAYADVMERALYNAILAGYSLDGTKFFYENRLASLGDHHRQEWFWCECCPPNYSRLIESLGQYVYSQSDTDAIIHLYVAGSANLKVGGRAVTLSQDTAYPWDGKVSVRVETERPATFGLRLRVPGWSRDARLSVNGEPVDMVGKTQKGYVRLERLWTGSDTVELELPMRVERMCAHPDVRSDVGRVALQRGPIVYCLEQVDNAAPLHRIVLPAESELTAHFNENLLGGVVEIAGEASAADDSDWKGRLYNSAPAKLTRCRITAVPYYAWDNRKPGRMVVWIPS